VYNTETAEQIGYDAYSNPGDFHHWEETLYRTQKGRYFIAGGGGPLSSWGVPISNNGRGGSTGIRALTEAEALDWCESHGVTAETIVRYFETEEA